MKRCFMLFMVGALMLSNISVYAAEEGNTTTIINSNNEPEIHLESLLEDIAGNQEVQEIPGNEGEVLDEESQVTDNPERLESISGEDIEVDQDVQVMQDHEELPDANRQKENVSEAPPVLGDGIFSHGERVGLNQSAIIGTLQAVNLNDFTVQIDNKKYPVGDDVDLNRATEILIEEECKIVGIVLEEGEILSLSSIDSLIYPTVELSLDVKNLTYSNGKMDKDKFKGTASISWAIERPYKLSDLERVKDEEAVSLFLDAIHLETVGVLYFEKGGLFSPNKGDVYKKINMTLKPGETKEVSFDIFVEDDYTPENISNSLSIYASLMLDDFFDHTSVSVGNLDLQREKEEEIKAKRESSKILEEAVNELDNVTRVIDESLLNEYFTAAQVKGINAQIDIWLAELIATATLIREDKNGVIDTILKKTGLDKDSVMKKVLGKLGLNENLLPTVGNTKATTRIYVPQNDITIYCSVDLRFNAFKESPPYAGFGTLNYYIIDGGKKKKPLATGMITYTDTTALQKVAENSIKCVYGEAWGKSADKVAEIIVGETICKILKKTTGGTFSDNLFTLMVNQTANYTKKISIHCPVDVYVYDAEGNICGVIENNIVDPSYDSIFMYVEGDEKYICFTEDDYTIRFVGNDTGEMKYMVEEYSDQNLLRSVVYDSVPLSKGKEYYSSIPDAVYLDNVVYDLVSGMDSIPASFDEWQDNLGKRVSTSGILFGQEKISLDVGKEYQLLVAVEPSSATIQLVEWKSLDESIATVSDEGKVKAVGEGETSIEATTVDGGFTAECKIIVNKKKGGVSIPQIPGNNRPQSPDNNTTQLPADIPGNQLPGTVGNSVEATDTVSPDGSDTSGNAASVQTGDSIMVMLWVLTAILALGICGGLGWKHYSAKK